MPIVFWFWVVILMTSAEYTHRHTPAWSSQCIYTVCVFCFYLFIYLFSACPQLPNGVTYHPNTHQDRLGKLQEHLRMLSVLFRKLRLVFDKCNENCAGLEPIPPEVITHFHTLFLLNLHSKRSQQLKDQVVHILK